VEVPLDLTVVCNEDGVLLHPGGYQLSKPALKKKDGCLKRDLETIVMNHELIDPTIIAKPRLRFLVEPGGEATFEEARRQTVLSGLPWPVSIQSAGASAPSLFLKEGF
jgi:hypothetical protein